MTASELKRINGRDVEVLGRSDRQSLRLLVVCVDGVQFVFFCSQYSKY